MGAFLPGIRSSPRVDARARLAMRRLIGRHGGGVAASLLQPNIAPLDMASLRSRGYASQLGQDVLLDALFRGLGVEQGFFVDVGAHDGETGSNTLFFERQRAWRGICIEPLPGPYSRLQASRSSLCLNCAISDISGVEDFLAISGYAEMLSALTDKLDPRHAGRIESELAEHGGRKQVLRVPVRRLDEILAEHNIDRIDLLSVDVEGSELAVARSLNLAETTIVAMAIENNHATDDVARYFAEHSHLRRVLRLGADDIYLNLRAVRELLPLTV